LKEKLQSLGISVGNTFKRENYKQYEKTGITDLLKNINLELTSQTEFDCVLYSSEELPTSKIIDSQSIQKCKIK